MKRRNVVLLAVVAGTMAWVGCENAAPTEPTRGFGAVHSDKTVAPGGLVLSGGWKGTITFHSFSGNSQGFACNGTAPIAVALEQDDASLTGGFPGGCAGQLNIRGVVAGSGLSGSLDFASGASLGRISGTVSSSRIAFQTKTKVTENDDGSPIRGGGRVVVSSEVELHRQEPAARIFPVPAGEGRAPRVVGVRR